MTVRTLVLLAVATGTILLVRPGAAIAQEAKEPPTFIDIFKEPKAFNREMEKTQVVRQLMAREDFEGAAALLETLHTEKPDDELYYNLLRTCYDRLQVDAKLIRLVEQRVTNHPDVFQHRLELAQAFLGADDHSAASENFRSALPVAKNDIDRLAVVEGMIAANLSDEALVLIDSLVEVVEVPIPFLLHRGALLEKKKDYAGAAREYLAIIGDTSKLASNAERKILDLLRFEESSPIVEKTLMGQIDSINSVRALMVLASHYRSAGDFSHAFDLALRQDQLEGSSGRALAQYMRSCRDQRQLEEAARTGNYLIASYPESSERMRVLLLLADVQVQLGQFPEAIACYDTVVMTTSLARDKSTALYEIGTIYLEHLDNPRRAEEYYDSVCTHFASGMGFGLALQRRPHCPLRLGELDRATTEFTRLRDHRLSEEAAEEINYFLALIDFCGGQFDSAAVAFQRIMVDYPRGFYVNDALELQMIIDKAAGDDSLLISYAEAVLYQVRGMSDSAVASLSLVADAPNKVLADVALYRMTELSLQQTDTTAALATVERLEQEAPDSYYLPYGLKIKADVLYLDEHTQATAREIYLLLLEQFADYPFGSEVRERLRLLMSQGEIG